MPLFGGRTPAELRERTTVAVLGMHRSGTSAVAGMLAEHGVEFGPVSERNRFNPRGNREIRELNRLHDEVLSRNGGSWWEPPGRIRLRRRDLRRRDEILGTIPGDPVAVKDPRMLLVMELWHDLDPRPIGVIRNPVAVGESLRRRARDRPRRHPQLAPGDWEDLWLIYNRALLAERRRLEFPLIDFDRNGDLDAQVRAALAFWGLDARSESSFFAHELTVPSPGDWRSRVRSSEALELWDELAGLSVAPARRRSS
jgi:hypothetical protein